MDVRNLHPSSKIIIILLVGVAIYAATFYSLSPAVPNGRGMGQGHMMVNFSTTGNIIVNSASMGAALAGMLFASLLLFRGHTHPALEKELHEVPEGTDEFSILKRALTQDETLLLEKVREVPEGITQDSLRFRLNWSKAKVSTMLTNLDRMGLVQRERFGKTYKVHYQEGKAGSEAK